MTERIFTIKTEWYEGEVVPSIGKYGNGRIAIELICPDGEPLCRATVNLPDAPIEDGYVFLKGWSENEGLPEALEEAGMVKLTDRKVATGFVYAQEAKLLIKV